MVLADTRVSYAREFIQSLSSPEDHLEDNLQQVLQESMSQSLEELEKRFRAYRDRFRLEQDPQKIQATVVRMEKRCNVRFYTETQQERNTEIRHIHREAIKNCYPILTSDLDLFQSTLMDDLLASDVVSISDKESIRGRDTRKRQNEEFFTYLVGRLTYNEFHRIFLPALSKDHQHLADALISELDRLEEEYQDLQCVACRAREHVQLKRLATPLLKAKVINLPNFSDLRSSVLTNHAKWALLKQIVSDADIINAMEQKYPDLYQEFQSQECISVECRCPSRDTVDTAALDIPPGERESEEESSVYEACFSEDTDLVDMEENLDLGEMWSFQEDLEQEYAMGSRPRGICLIINNNYILGTKYKPSVTSEVDVLNLSATFRRLQFSVIYEEVLTAKKMKTCIKRYSRLDHSSYDAFVCAILNYGGALQLITGCDRVGVKLTNLTSMFTASRCPSLAGKPKIFLFESIRGVSPMTGLKDEQTKEIIAEEADFLIGYSTAEGCLSFKKMETGSLYINALTNVLDTKADQHDLLECLTMTNREVSRLSMKVGSFHEVKQVPAPVFTLTKKVHFTSDPLWPHSPDTT